MRIPRELFRKISPYAVMVLLVSVSAYLWISEVEVSQNYLNDQTEKVSEEIQMVIQDQIQVRFEMLQDLALKWSSDTYDSQISNYTHFANFFSSLYNVTGGFLAINFINTSKIISWVYPLEGNLGALNQSINYTADGVFNYALDSAFKTGEYNYTGLIPFLQGGYGFASYFPVYYNGTLIGCINGVFSLDKLFNRIIEGSERIVWLEDYSLIVSDQAKSIFEMGTKFNPLDKFVISNDFTIGRIPVTLYLQPNVNLREQASYEENISPFILGILLAIIIGIFMLLIERNYRKLNQSMVEKAQMEQIIYRKQKFESLGTLAGGIAHDFNNILFGIQGNIELTIANLTEIKEELNLHPELQQKMKELFNNSYENLNENQELIKQSVEINRQITDFSSGSQDSFGLFNLRELLSSSLNSFSKLVDKRILIEEKYDDLNPFLICDSSRFKQVIMNILINARDAMTDHQGKIEISIKTQKQTQILKIPQKVQIFAKIKNIEMDSSKNLIVAIKDTGEGIPEENLDKIFDPFFTTKRGEKHGTGLGLSIVYMIIHSLGGRINVESKVGVGSTFYLILPHISEKNEKMKLPDKFSRKENNSSLKNQQIFSCPNCRVLLIEDEKIIRKNIKRYLESGKIFVISVENGQKGWNFFSEHRKDIDVVILDINLPGMNGIDVYKHIKEIKPTQATLFTTGYSDIEFPNYDEYDLGLLKKPFSLESLGQKIQEYYNQRCKTRIINPQ